jgi:hypothetical protein
LNIIQEELPVKITSGETLLEIEKKSGPEDTDRKQ